MNFNRSHTGLRRTPRIHGISDGARDVAATGASNGITLGVVLGLLPKLAAALSVTISVIQIGVIVRRAWRKWRKGCPRRRKRLARLFGKRRRRC